MKESKEKSSQRNYVEKLRKFPWILFAVTIMLVLALSVRVEIVARDTKTLAEEIQQLRQSLKEIAARQDLEKEDFDIVRGR